VYAIRFPVTHMCRVNLLLAAAIVIVIRRDVFLRVRVYLCARTGDGTGDKRIGHARGIYPGRGRIRLYIVCIIGDKNRTRACVVIG